MALTAERALRRLAAHGLPRADSENNPIEVDSLDRLLMLADTQRVLAPVHRAVQAGMVVNADDEWRADLRERLFAAAETTLAAHAEVMDAGRRLHRKGITPIVIKGCATGPLDYAHAADRFSSDVDLLVAAEHQEATLRSLGGTATDVARGRRWQQRYGHASAVTAPSGVEVDVHVRLNHGYVGLAVAPSEFLEHTESFEIGGQHLVAPDLPNRLLLAAVHSEGVHCSLHKLRDIPQLVLAAGADWALAVERAQRWKIDRFVAGGVLSAWSALGLDPHPIVDWAQHHRPVGRQRILGVIPGDGARRQVLAGPLALPPWRWPGYIAPLLFPSRDYVRRTGKGWRARAGIVREELVKTDRDQMML